MEGSISRFIIPKKLGTDKKKEGEGHFNMRPTMAKIHARLIDRMQG
jgi:hypothetical protein